MGTLRKHRFWVGGVALVGAVLLFVVLFNRPDASKSSSSLDQSPRQSGDHPKKISQLRSTASADLASTSGPYYVEHFNSVLRPLQDVSALYEGVVKLLGPGEINEMIAIYVAEAIARNDSPQFSRFMASLHEALNARAIDVADALLAQNETLKKDPFVYQMTLNLAYVLNVESAKKAQMLGGALKIPFAFDNAGGITLQSANVTTALILMKNAQIPFAQVRPFVEQGVEVNRHDPQALKEFLARVRTYYPDLAGF
jgi:hypothetical protein